MLSMYRLKICIDVHYPLWEWSGYCMDSRGIAARFPTGPKDFSTIVRAQAGYGEHTHTHKQTNTHGFSMTIAGFLFGDKEAGVWSWWLNLVYCSARECSDLYFKSPTLLHALHRKHCSLMLQYWFINVVVTIWKTLSFEDSCLINNKF